MATSAAQRVFDIAELKNLICIKHHGLMSPTAKIINDAIETLKKGGDLGFTEKGPSQALYGPYPVVSALQLFDPAANLKANFKSDSWK